MTSSWACRAPAAVQQAAGSRIFNASSRSLDEESPWTFATKSHANRNSRQTRSVRTSLHRAAHFLPAPNRMPPSAIGHSHWPCIACPFNVTKLHKRWLSDPLSRNLETEATGAFTRADERREVGSDRA